MAVPVLQISGWPVSVENIEPGHFMWRDQLCFKTEYKNENNTIQIYNSAGEAMSVFAGDKVTPVICDWVAEDD